MKVEISSEMPSDTQMLSSVAYGRFAQDKFGNIYFAPSTFWLVYSPSTGQISGVENSFVTPVIPLPYGTQLILTSTKD